MGQIVHRIEARAQVEHELATVVEIDDGTIIYDAPHRSRGAARVAAACLLEPRVGDRVLVVERGSEAYVLSVLERDVEVTARLRVEGDLEVSAGGKVSVIADTGIELVTKGALRFLSKALKVRASEGEVAVDRLVLLSREAVANTRVAKFVSSKLESFVERLEQHVTTSFRTVEEVEELRARRLDYRMQEELSLRGKHAFVHAADLVKVTGAQIHMG